MNTDSFIVHLKTDDIYKDSVENVKKGFDTSNYELVRPLAKGKNKNVIGLMKVKIGGKIIKKVVYINGVASSKRQNEKFEIL